MGLQMDWIIASVCHHMWSVYSYYAWTNSLSLGTDVVVWYHLLHKNIVDNDMLKKGLKWPAYFLSAKILATRNTI